MREVEQLSPAELAGQLLVVGFDGTELPQPIGAALARRTLAGVVLFRRNLPELSSAHRLCQQISEASSIEFPPFIAVDQEGGRVARLRQGVIQLPPMRVLGRLGDLELCAALATQQALELRALGFNLNFAPVTDVDSNPENPIIGDRAFGASPELVTRHARAFVDAFQAVRLMACLKHYPGHGDTNADSHLTLPHVQRDSLSLRQIELYPFERLAPAAASIMTAHVVFESFDSVPATLSGRLCEGLLRKEFGFDGVLFSDDLEMGALSQNWPIEESSVLAIEAGCDCLLVCSQPDLQARAARALEVAIASDSKFRQRCERAVSRSLRARRDFAPTASKSFAEFEALIHSATRKALDMRLHAL